MTRRTRWLAAGTGLVSVLLGASVLAHRFASRTLRIGTLDRTYEIHVPSNLPPGKAVPLVLVFHGGYGNGKGIERFTGFDALADKEGFIVAYPDGFRRNWNDGRDMALSPLRRRGLVDDVAFVSALIGTISREHHIDPARIYATGISNGAMFSHYLAGHLAGKLAAIAPVCGGIATTYASQLKPSEPVSVLLIAGTADPLVPYVGGGVAGGRFGTVLSTDDTVAKWREADGISGTATKEPLPDRDPTDGCTAARQTWPKGRNGAEVALIRIEGGGHTWPGRAQYLPKAAVGPVCRDFNATQVIWEFFKKHPKATTDDRR